MNSVTLKEICEVFGDGDWIESKDQSDSGIRLIQTGNVGVGKFKDRVEKARWISEETFKKLRCTEIIEGDVLISRLPDPVGRSCLIPALEHRAITAVDCSIVRFDPKRINAKFFIYYSQSSEYAKAIGPLISGSTRQRISRENLGAIKIPLPSLDEQDEIVANLDSAFAEIDLLEENLKLSDDKTNQLLQSLLSAEYSLEGIPAIPLEKLVDILDNQRIPINSTERLQRLGYVPYYGATGQVGTIDKAIFNETLILLGEDGVPFFDSTKHKAYEISGPSWVNNHAHVLRAKPGLVNQRYLLHFLNIFNYNGYVNGATRLKLTQSDMKRIPVPLPNMETQEKIVLKIDLAFEVIRNLNEQINQKKEFALALRQSLLSSAFTQEEAVA
jgi:type I restriction enzyme S subunit